MYESIITLKDTKQALANAAKAFAATPSATNWQALTKAMQEHQDKHQETADRKASQKLWKL